MDDRDDIDDDGPEPELQTDDPSRPVIDVAPFVPPVHNLWWVN